MHSTIIQGHYSPASERQRDFALLHLAVLPRMGNGEHPPLALSVCTLFGFCLQLTKEVSEMIGLTSVGNRELKKKRNGGANSVDLLNGGATPHLIISMLKNQNQNQ